MATHDNDINNDINNNIDIESIVGGEFDFNTLKDRKVLMYGYARVSTKEQILDRQLIKFYDLGIPDDRIYTDKESGKNLDRNKYQALRKVVKKGNVIIFDALDRLGRDFNDIMKEWQYFTVEIGADIIVLENPSLFNSAKWRSQGTIGKAMEIIILALLAYLAESERLKLLTRTSEGREVARSKGVKFGRKEKLITKGFVAAYQDWKADKRTAKETWEHLGLSKTTFYKLVKKYEDTLPYEGA